VSRTLIPLLLLAALCPPLAAQSTPRHAPPQRRRAEVLTRSLAGTVWRKGTQQPLLKAVVYLTNSKTLEVRTFITRGDGRYRFDSLSPNTDYEVFVIFNGKRSDTKTLSSFDSRPEAYINFKMDAPATQNGAPPAPR